MKVLDLIWHYLWKENSSFVKFLLIMAVLALAISKGFNVIVPIILKEAVDKLSLGIGNISLILVAFYGLARFASQAFSEIKELCFVHVSQNAVKNLASNVFRELNNLSLKFHLDRKTGGVNLSINRGVKALENILTFSTFIVVPVIFELVITCGVIFWIYDLRYLAITVVTLGIYVFYTIYVTQKRTKYIRQMKSAENDFNSKAVDVLLNYETVKYFCKEIYEEHSYSDLLKRYNLLAIKNKFFLSLLNIGQVLIIAIGLTVVMVSAAKEVTLGIMTVGDFLLINLYLIQLYQPLGNLGFAYREVTLSMVDLRDMREQLESGHDLNAPQQSHSNIDTEGSSVVFQDVYFSYNQDRQILNGVSFALPEGKMLAIVGSSGAGKSTIARLIYRFYEIQSGSLIVGGQDIREMDIVTLRSKIGIVPQDTVLFNDTIFYNIAYGAQKIDVSAEEVESAAIMANLHDFVLSLPDKYNTRVGERGLKLSGGEKQRVAIARLLLKKPEIYIFDEATSALDTATEKAIQSSIKKIAKHKTSIVIAHRLSTVVDADTIIVLSDGVVVEQGAHDELFNAKGSYYKLWMEQQRSSQ